MVWYDIFSFYEILMRYSTVYIMKFGILSRRNTGS
jgi:hypothetical protein